MKVKATESADIMDPSAESSELSKALSFKPGVRLKIALRSLP